MCSKNESLIGELKSISMKYLGVAWDRIPLILTEGSGVTVKDIQGREYIDCTAQAWTLSTGYRHPKVIKAVKAQLDQIEDVFFTYDNIPMLRLTQRLIEITPEKFNKVFFSLSGSEAIEGAMRLAMRYTGGQEFVTLYHAYHGRTFITEAISHTYPTYVSCKRGMEKFTPKPIRIPNFYCYRCYFDHKYPDCKLLCVKFLENALKHQADTKVAGVILEPIQANGGQIIPPPGYLQELRRICSENGVLLIYDEVQTGMGRCGKMFAADVYQIYPDILVIGKGLGAGFPLSCIITNEKYGFMEKGEWGFTYAGSPISCAAGLAVIDVLLEEKLIGNADKMGKLFLEGLNQLAKKYPIIGEIRGKGLMIGVEIVKDKNTKEPGPNETRKILMKAQEKGVLLGKSGLGPHGNVFKIKPALNISKQQVAEVLRVLDEVLEEVAR